MSPPQRIASLLASATDLVCALGLGQRLVARSHECDHPQAAHLPLASRPAFDITGTSAEVDARVRARLHAGLPLYEVDDALLERLRPDVILSQTHCEVCAVAPADVTRGGSPILCRTPVVPLGASTLDGVLASFVAVASVLGDADAGQRLVGDLNTRAAAVAARWRGRARPRTVCLEWTAPLFAMGNWGPDLVAAAGGDSVLGEAGALSRTTAWHEVVEARPEVLIVTPCGYDLERAGHELDVLSATPGFADLPAVRSGRVYAADGNRLFNRSGPTLWDTIEVLAEVLHPDVFEPRHEGRLWQRWPGVAGP